MNLSLNLFPTNQLWGLKNTVIYQIQRAGIQLFE